ncbi:MAG: hypothetical protein WCD53_08755 [Microcoleus sp.]
MYSIYHKCDRATPDRSGLNYLPKIAETSAFFIKEADFALVE